jgi:uncharacterized protein YndB with AHSA1/START domain
MAKSQFVYGTYVRTTPEKLWDALTKPEITRAYWYGAWHDAKWEPGAPWKLMAPDGRVADSGEVIETERARRLVLKWRHELTAELRAEGYSRCTLDLERFGDMVKLTTTHEIGKQKSKLLDALSNGCRQYYRASRACWKLASHSKRRRNGRQVAEHAR